MKNGVIIITIILSHFLFLVSFGQNSVLSEGKWIKIGVLESGIYKIDKTFLNNIGVATENLDPRTLRVYGNNISMLPQENNATRPVDLIENAIWGIGIEDGTWDATDYFLFYAHGPNQYLWKESQWQFTKNIYSDTAYFFINYGSSNGKRITNKTPLNLQNTTPITKFRDVLTYEKDERNHLGNSGREWYSDVMAQSVGLTKEIYFNTPNIIDSIFIYTRLMATAEENTKFDIGLNENKIGEVFIKGIPESTYAIKGFDNDNYFQTISQSSQQSIKISLQEPGRFGFINQIVVSYDRALTLTNNKLILTIHWLPKKLQPTT